MSLTKCPHCEDQHVCHRVDGANPGELLYDELGELLDDGKIGTPTIPWKEVPAKEKTAWKRVATH